MLKGLIFFDMRRVSASVWYTQTHLARKWSNSPAMGLDESQAAFGWVLLTSHLVYIPPAFLGYRPHEIIRSWSHVSIIRLATNSIIIIINNNNNLSLEQWQCLAKNLSLRSSSRCLFKNLFIKNVHPFGTKQNVSTRTIKWDLMGLTNSRIPELLLFSTASNCSTAHYVVDMMTWWLATAPGHKNP